MLDRYCLKETEMKKYRRVRNKCVSGFPGEVGVVQLQVERE